MNMCNLCQLTHVAIVSMFHNKSNDLMEFVPKIGRVSSTSFTKLMQRLDRRKWTGSLLLVASENVDRLVSLPTTLLLMQFRFLFSKLHADMSWIRFPGSNMHEKKSVLNCVYNLIIC